MIIGDMTCTSRHSHFSYKVKAFNMEAITHITMIVISHIDLTVDLAAPYAGMGYSGLHFRSKTAYSVMIFMLPDLRCKYTKYSV